MEWGTDLSQAEIEQKIKEYNGQINSNLFSRPGELTACSGEIGTQPHA